MMIVKGKTYRTGPTGILQLATLRAVKREFDLSWRDIREWFDKLDAEQLEGAETSEMLVEPEFEAWVYAWVTNVDGVMSRADFEKMELADIVFTESIDEKDPEVESADDDEPPDPTQASDRTDSGPGGASPRKSSAPKKSTTKTSKRQ